MAPPRRPPCTVREAVVVSVVALVLQHRGRGNLQLRLEEFLETPQQARLRGLGSTRRLNFLLRISRIFTVLIHSAISTFSGHGGVSPGHRRLTLSGHGGMSPGHRHRVFFSSEFLFVLLALAVLRQQGPLSFFVVVCSCRYHNCKKGFCRCSCCTQEQRQKPFLLLDTVRTVVFALVCCSCSSRTTVRNAFVSVLAEQARTAKIHFLLIELQELLYCCRCLLMSVIVDTKRRWYYTGWLVLAPFAHFFSPLVFCLAPTFRGAPWRAP